MINRKGTIYVELPEELQTGKKKDASITISISIVGTKSIEGKKGQDFIDESMEEIGAEFKKFVKKRTKKELSGD